MHLSAVTSYAIPLGFKFVISLLVHKINCLFPLSLAFKSKTAWPVVPEPAKKSNTIAFLFISTKSIQIFTNSIGFGFLKTSLLLKILFFNKVVPEALVKSLDDNIEVKTFRFLSSVILSFW